MIRKETAELLHRLYFAEREIMYKTLPEMGNWFCNEALAQDISDWYKTWFKIDISIEQIMAQETMGDMVTLLENNVNTDEIALTVQMCKLYEVLIDDVRREHKEQTEAMLGLVQDVSNSVNVIQSTLLKMGEEEE